jgi:large subunit ribosomal protein L9
MKVLLCEDIENVGWLGDVVDVSAGYARNYLFPQGLGVKPTDDAVRSLAGEKAKRSEERKLVREQLERACKAVENAKIMLKAKTNEQGHLFGSVAERDIAGELREKGFEVSDKMVKMDEHIKEVGEYQITLKYASELSTTVEVVVLSENAEVEITKDETEEGNEGQSVESEVEQS